jgi:Mlc titration factor MtfA (ptsG expression regulator)
VRLDATLWRALLAEHPIVAGLDADELTTLRGLVDGFLTRKRFESPGMEATLEMYAVVALQASLPVLGLGAAWLEGWRTVVIVPTQFESTFSEVDEAGVVHEWTDEVAGESWDEGPLTLSWDDVESSGWGDGFSVVVHEVAHKLDLTDGAMNGRPRLHPDLDPAAWHAELGAAFAQRSREGSDALIDAYALENAAEFFAVTSELFFERPAELRRWHPGAYGQLVGFYRQDPAIRDPSPGRK